MSVKDRRRLEVVALYRERKVTAANGERLLGLSLRQFRRVWKRCQEVGDGGLIHGLRGKPSNRAVEGNRKGDEQKKLFTVLHRKRVVSGGSVRLCRRRVLQKPWESTSFAQP